MRSGTIVTGPDGERWRVRRRWTNRSWPDLRRHLRRGQGGGLEAGMQAAGSADLTDSIWVPIVAGIAVGLVVLVALPLIGIALELIFLFVVLSSGILGRVVLRRPWIVEAVNLDHPERSAVFAIKGWRSSSQKIDELTRSIPVDGPISRP